VTLHVEREVGETVTKDKMPAPEEFQSGIPATLKLLQGHMKRELDKFNKAESERT
jgi:hypothetical protein